MVPAYEGDKPYLFVSYAHKNSALVLPVIEALFEKKYRIWYDEGIAAGSEWPKNIADHLNGAAGYVIFTSPQSLTSENCENEVVKAVEQTKDGNKKLYAYELGARHEKLKDAETVCSAQELMQKLPEVFIGDGSGYERGVGKGRSFRLWNGLILVAAAMAITMGVGLYGLNQGWFDQILPGLSQAQQTAEQMGSEAQVRTQDMVSIENDLLANAVAGQLGKSELTEKLSFSGEEARKSFYDSLGYDASQGDMTYLDLTAMGQEDVWLDRADDQILEYLTYLPNLRRVNIPYTQFPLTIPQERQYQIEVR